MLAVPAIYPVGVPMIIVWTDRASAPPTKTRQGIGPDGLNSSS